MVELITKRLIDSVWTIVAVIDDTNKTARVLKYDRENKLGYELESDCRHGAFIEDENRVVKSIIITGDKYNHTNKITDKYKVSNPKYIFDYK